MTIKKYKIFVFVGAVIVWLVVLLPHILIPMLQNKNGIDLVYTPNNLAHNWTHFDDICKLNQSFNLVKNGTLHGHISVSEDKKSLDPGVLQELVPAVIYAGFVQVFKRNDIPYYVLGVFVSLTLVMFIAIGMQWGMKWPICMAIGIISIFGYQFHYPETLSTYLLNFDLIDKVVTSKNEELNGFYRISALGGTYFIFLYGIYLMQKMWLDASLNYKRAIAVGVITALQYYTYIFYAITLSIISIFGCLYYLALWKSGVSKTESKNKFLMALIGGLLALTLALPSMLDVFKTLATVGGDYISKMDGGAWTTKRFWANKEVLYFGVIVFAISSSLYFRLVLLGVVSSVLLIENAQFVFGFNIQQGHIYSRTAMPIIVFMGFASVYNLLISGCSKRFYYILVTSIFFMYSAIFLTEAIRYGYFFAKETSAYQGLTNSQIQLIEWFKDKRTSTVVATLSPEIAIPLNIETGVKLYNKFAMYDPAEPVSSIIHKLAITFYPMTKSKDSISRYFSPEGSDTEKRYQFYYFQYFYRSKDENIVKNLVADDIFEKYFQIKENYCKTIANEFDYLVTVNDSSKAGEFQLQGVGSECFKPSKTFGPYVVYQPISKN